MLLTFGVIITSIASVGAAQTTDTPTPENNTTDSSTATQTPSETPTETATGTSKGSAVPSFIIEIVTSTDPTAASDEQLNTVREWFFSNSDSLSETERNNLGSWISEASTSDRDPSTTENSNEPQNVVAEINDNLVLRDYSFNRSNGTVTLVLSAKQFTEQVKLTDPSSAESEGVGKVNDEEITVPSGQTVEVTFPLGFSPYSGSATVWVASGDGTIYVSNSAQELIDRLQWVMIPVAGFAAAMSVFVSGLIYVWRKYRSVNNEYTNIFRNL